MKDSKKNKEALMGQLEVCVRMARNLQQKVLVGKQSPFVLFELGSEHKRTVCDKRGGRNPQWSETLTFSIFPSNLQMKVKCYNQKSKIQSEYIGETVLDLKVIMEEREKDSWYRLLDRDEYAGDLYIELSYFPEGEPREKPAPKAEPISEIEEGLSMLELKNIQRDPRLNEVSLPSSADPFLTPPNPHFNPELSRTYGSSASLSSGMSGQDIEPIPAQESDLANILDEIRSLVDYPYEASKEPVDNEDSMLSPGALPRAGKRKPLPPLPGPLPPPQSHQSVGQYQPNRFSNPIPITPQELQSLGNGRPLSANLTQANLNLNQLGLSHPTYPPAQRQSLPHINEHYLAPQPNYTRSPSPAPSSQISELYLSDPMYSYQSSSPSMTRTSSFQRRGSADSIVTRGSYSDQPLDFDPTTQIQISTARTPSVKRRPLEAPSVMQTYQAVNPHRLSQPLIVAPYAEDVRGRVVPHYHPAPPPNHHFSQHQVGARPIYPSPHHQQPRPHPSPMHVIHQSPRPLAYPPRPVPPSPSPYSPRHLAYSLRPLPYSPQHHPSNHLPPNPSIPYSPQLQAYVSSPHTQSLPQLPLPYNSPLATSLKGPRVMGQFSPQLLPNPLNSHSHPQALVQQSPLRRALPPSPATPQTGSTQLEP